MAKQLNDEQIAQRKMLRERFLASSKLEGIELSDRVQAMFDLMDEEGWDTQKCIDFIKENLTSQG